MSTLFVQGSDANQAPISTKTKIPKLETADPKGRALEALRPGSPGTTPRTDISSTAKDCIRSWLFLECLLLTNGIESISNSMKENLCEPRITLVICSTILRPAVKRLIDPYPRYTQTSDTSYRLEEVRDSSKPRPIKGTAMRAARGERRPANSHILRSHFSDALIGADGEFLRRCRVDCEDSLS